jgi:urease accessory protein
MDDSVMGESVTGKSGTGEPVIGESVMDKSVMLINARVGVGATLRFAPEPTVLAAGCSHRMVVRLSLAADASAYWREEIVFGRHGEQPGRCHSRFDATIGGRPLLRQEFVVGDPEIDHSPAVFGDARCVGSILLAGRDQEAKREAVIGEGWAALPLAGPGLLVTALAADAIELRHRLELGERSGHSPAARPQTRPYPQPHPAHDEHSLIDSAADPARA